MSLADLPFDIIHQIASQLDIRSFDSLGKSCKALSRHLRNDNTAKNALQVHMGWSFILAWNVLTSSESSSVQSVGANRPIASSGKFQTDTQSDQ